MVSIENNIELIDKILLSRLIPEVKRHFDESNFEFFYDNRKDLKKSIVYDQEARKVRRALWFSSERSCEEIPNYGVNCFWHNDGKIASNQQEFSIQNYTSLYFKPGLSKNKICSLLEDVCDYCGDMRVERDPKGEIESYCIRKLFYFSGSSIANDWDVSAHNIWLFYFHLFQIFLAIEFYNDKGKNEDFAFILRRFKRMKELLASKWK